MQDFIDGISQSELMSEDINNVALCQRLRSIYLSE